MASRGGQGFQGNYRGSSGTGGRGVFSGRGRNVEPKQVFQQEDTQEFSVSAVTTLEDRLFPPDSVQQLENLKIDDVSSIPIRPGFGNTGSTIEMYTNFVEMSIKSPKPIYKYWISILVSSAEQEPKGKKRARVIALLLEQLPKLPLLATDGKATIIASAKFAATLKDYLVSYYREDEDFSRASQHYTVRVEYSTTLDLKDLTTCLNSTDLQAWRSLDMQEWIQALNIIIGHKFEAASTEIMSRQNKYFPYADKNKFTEKFPLDDVLSALRGYFVSSRPATGRMLLQIQVKHMAFWNPASLSDVLSRLAKTGDSHGRTRALLTKLRVRLTHLKHPKFKRITGLATLTDGLGLERPPMVDVPQAKSHQVQFWLNDEVGYVNHAKYFKEKYNISSNLPVVNTGTRDQPEYYPPEVCQIEPGEPMNHQLSSEQITAMIGVAVRKPHQNAKSIATNGIEFVEEYSGQMLREIGVGIGKCLVRVNGRVLLAPNVEYAKSKTVRPNGASWNMINTIFAQGTSLPTWSVVWVELKPSKESGRTFRDTFTDVSDLQVCINRFKEVLTKSGVQAGTMLPTRSVVIQDEDRCRMQIEGYCKKAVNYGCKLLLFVLPKKSTAIYNTIKKVGDLAYGIHTICVTGPVFGRNRHQPAQGGVVPNVQTFANLALKVNLKLGGCNQQLSRANLDFISNGKTMLVGLDVTHPAPGQDEAPSVSAIVASVDNKLGQWLADIRVQKRRQEMVQDLEVMFVGRLQIWQKHNQNALPDEIILYRDGVSEGQYDVVLQTELPQIRKACERVYAASQIKSGLPRITIVVVGKRHNTRFYPTRLENADATGNTKNGTVVDRGVTQACVWDFYLQAHTALQGTARPAHYVVIHDEIFRARFKNSAAADALCKVTHNLCYLFGRATKAVSVCPPAYYADIACERARCWLSRVFDDSATVSSGGSKEVSNDEIKIHDNLKDTMFFI